jgi:hypothetical protein
MIRRVFLNEIFIYRDTEQIKNLIYRTRRVEFCIYNNINCLHNITKYCMFFVQKYQNVQLRLQLEN